MGYALCGLGGLLLLVGVICQIMVLVKLFQTEGAGKGILGFICGLYLLYWGFTTGSKLGLSKVMIGWIVCSIIGGVMLAVGVTMTAVVVPSSAG